MKTTELTSKLSTTNVHKATDIFDNDFYHKHPLAYWSRLRHELRHNDATLPTKLFPVRYSINNRLRNALLQQIGTDWDEILQGDIGSRSTFPCKRLALSAKRTQNGAEKKSSFANFFLSSSQQNNASFRCTARWTISVKFE